MQNPSAAGVRGWKCARSSDFDDGYLLWLPPLLLASDNRPSLASSLIAALAVLLVAAVFWADGRGRAASWADTIFAFGWMGAWSITSGLLLLDRGRGGDFGGPGAVLCLAAGAAVLAWSWASRSRLPLEGATSRRRSPIGTDAVIWVGASAVLLLVLSLASPSLLWADAAALALALVLFLLLTPRGRASRPCGASR